MVNALKRHIIGPYAGIFVIWLFHISGILGIYFGDTEWFTTKTPLNLIISLAIFIWLFPINTKEKWILLILFTIVGMLVEWLGVTYGLFFGNYSYGSNLGVKLDGVPYLIGFYWALLTFITAEIVKRLGISGWLKIGLGALLMVGLDFLIEQNAPTFDLWQFEGHVPIDNYISWFVIGFVLHTILDNIKVEGNQSVSIHLYMAQVIFFTFFYFFPI
ncbi:carotenoid biosynthesis protein [uncultured Croceitalea sp.]|uniref:carotenoid biosynthesis protein n=1 Tax=uncultured Croceitalea sp. TaxID=1798908 RepID=UPI0033065C0C